MKMTECFSLPLSARESSIANHMSIDDSYGDVVVITDKETNPEAICLAVNMHDEMVNALESMEALMLGILNDEDTCIQYSHLYNLKQLLIKVKGETEC